MGIRNHSIKVRVVILVMLTITVRNVIVTK